MDGIRTQLRRLLSKYAPDKINRIRGAIRLQKCRKRYDLPFDMPFTGIAIETCTDCTLKCKFCPQSTNPRPKMMMEESLFKQLIDNLAELNFAGRICPLTNNEPLLDDRMVSFIAYARQI